LLDWRTQDELIGIYDSHGIHLAHSLYEGAAKACTEAMARGQALVSSAVGALKDHVVQGGNGFLLPVGQVEAMASQVVALLRSRELVERVGASAVQSVKHLSWRHCAERSLDFYRRLAEMRPGATA
jgi:glycosyltransferase involved in cell wall biosynthesis